MRFTQTKQGNVIFIKGQYYIVNDLTFNLLKMYYEKKTVDEIAEALKTDADQVQKLYNQISEQLIEGKEYKDSIQFLQPLKVQWKITNRCNIRCKHCYEGEKNIQQLSDEQINSIFEKLINSKLNEENIPEDIKELCEIFNKQYQLYKAILNDTSVK